MRHFAGLFATLDATTRTGQRVAALLEFFRTAPDADALWTVALLSGRRPHRAATTRELRLWAAEVAGIPDWLFEESYAVAGDLAETIALTLPPPAVHIERGLAEWMAALRDLAGAAPETRRAFVTSAWDGLSETERLVFNKLITGGFRMGVSQTLMTRALAQATGRDAAELAHRLMGDWTPETTSFARLVLSEDAGDDAARPYPFCLAHPLENGPEALGDPANWLAEWKWDGIRGQVIRRAGESYLWSRGEELIGASFPELAAAAAALPAGTVLDGEILAWPAGVERPLPLEALQRRLGRRTVPKRLLAEAPCVFLAYDLLETGGQDLRAAPLTERRARLEALVALLPAGGPLRLSPLVPVTGWPALATARASARDRGAEGLMLKHRAATYRAGRHRGDWLKWKLDPFSVDAVMVYAQAGHGRRATLYTDFTFAVWDGDVLVPVTKAYSGLTDAEFRAITAWVRRNTTDRFGPVRQVSPELVFEIAFEGLRESPRHKSGLALRFPRMVRWRRDKPAAEAGTLEDLRKLLAAAG